MRQNLTKKDLINSIYMQLGYSKKLIENIIEDIFELILNVAYSSIKSIFYYLYEDLRFCLWTFSCI